MNVNRLSILACAVLAVVILPFSLRAATETVNGIKWTYTVSWGGASLGGGNNKVGAVSTTTSGAITIPSTLGGYPVTSIGRCAFYNCSGLKSVKIPDTVTSIGRCAFYNCSGLKSVTIPKSVTDIGECTFSYCSGLKSVTIPDSVTSIGYRAFDGCTSLTSVTIPNSVTSIEVCAFDGCSSLTSFAVGSGNSNYCSVNRLLLSKDGRTLIFGVKGDVTIPNSVTSIGASAFSGRSGLKSVTIPNSVTSIGVSAFYDCSDLTSVTIPDSVKSIGNSAFMFCSGLKSLTIGNGVTSIGTYAFGGCSSLKSVTIPPSVTSIESYAFSGCSGLETLYLPVRFRGKTSDIGIYRKCTVVFYSAAYTVAFNANGGKGKMASQKMPCGKAAKLRANAFTRAGWIFAGWATSKTNAKKGKIAYANRQSVKNLRAHGKTMTLYAVWAKKTYKVKFYANGGKGKMAVEKFTYGKAKKLSANKFKRKGYVFKGWAKSKALAKKGKVAYKNKAKVKNLVTTGKTVKLYAVWYEIRHSWTAPNTNGGKVSAGEPPLTGLVAYYPFDGDLRDAGVNEYHLSGNGQFTRDRFGNLQGAICFDGHDGQRLNNEDSNVWHSFSVSCWVQTDVSKDYSTYHVWAYGNYPMYPPCTESPGAGVSFKAGIDGITVVEHGPCYQPEMLTYEADIGNGWNHICMVVKNDTTVCIYLNGELVATGSLSDREKRFNTLSVGGEGWGCYTGSIDDLCVYNRALTGEEVMQLYLASFSSTGITAYAIVAN